MIYFFINSLNSIEKIIHVDQTLYRENFGSNFSCADDSSLFSFSLLSSIDCVILKIKKMQDPSTVKRNAKEKIKNEKYVLYIDFF